MSELLQSVQNQTFSFPDLLKSCSVNIHIIQRDYAQGRKTGIAEQIRNSFLDSIANAIKRAKENVTAQPLSLDFIYGTIENDALEPIDGQQRLTTLFLLHWYYAAKENRNDASNLLKKFRYLTRTSSTEFCTNLCTHIDAFQQKASFNNSLSAAIRDSSWFMLAWKDDPTVSAMLTMLDAIDQHLVLGTLVDVYPLYEKNFPIAFQFNFEFVRESLENCPVISGIKTEKLLLSSLELSAGKESIHITETNRTDIVDGDKMEIRVCLSPCLCNIFEKLQKIQTIFNYSILAAPFDCNEVSQILFYD